MTLNYNYMQFQMAIEMLQVEGWDSWEHKGKQSVRFYVLDELSITMFLLCMKRPKLTSLMDRLFLDWSIPLQNIR